MAIYILRLFRHPTAPKSTGTDGLGKVSFHADNDILAIKYVDASIAERLSNGDYGVLYREGTKLVREWGNT